MVFRPQITRGTRNIVLEWNWSSAGLPKCCHYLVCSQCWPTGCADPNPEKKDVKPLISTQGQNVQQHAHSRCSAFIFKRASIGVLYVISQSEISHVTMSSVVRNHSFSVVSGLSDSTPSTHPAVCSTGVISSTSSLLSPPQPAQGHRWYLLGRQGGSGLGRGDFRLAWFGCASRSLLLLQNTSISQALPLNPCHGPDALVHTDFFKIKEWCFSFFWMRNACKYHGEIWCCRQWPDWYKGRRYNL